MVLDPDRTVVDVITPIAPDPAYAELYLDRVTTSGVSTSGG
jgi:hypothetical protein